MVLLIDHYDSFSFNIYQLIGSLVKDIKVIRSDEMTVKEIRELAPDCVILSPGTGRPKDAGVYEELLETCQGEFPILGICLGHQAMGEVFGATVGYAKEVMHGKQSVVTQCYPSILWKDIPQEFPVARYHSLAVLEDTLGDELVVTARTSDGEIMAMEHRTHPMYGVQFHPESILTPQGTQMVKNFLEHHKII